MARAGFLVRAMLGLRSQERTGVLRISVGDTQTFVYLKSGDPIFAEEGSAGETLGRLLLRQNRLTQTQYLEILSKMTDALFFNEQIRFGETAVALGYLTEQQVETALRDQVRWKIVRCFQADEATWTFEDNPSVIEDVGDFRMALEGLVLDAVLWLDADRRSALGLGEAQEKYLFVPPPARVRFVEALRDEAGLEAFLAQCDGQRTTRQLLAANAAGSLDPEAIVTTLLMLGTGRLTPERQAQPPREPPPRRDEARDPRSFVPLPGAKPPEPPARPAPPAGPRPPLRPRSLTPFAKKTPEGAIVIETIDHKKTSEIVGKLHREPPRHPADAELARTPASPHEQRLLAEQAFQRGRVHLDAERTAQALTAFKRAVELAPDNPEFSLLTLWCEARSRVWADEDAAAELRRRAALAVSRDPNLAFGYHILGYLAFAAQDLERAKKFFARALKLDPSIKDAERHLRLTQARLDANKPKK
ncbi:MAG: tetratricopeptide repeat protein [Polyangiaceae bacterium]